MHRKRFCLYYLVILSIFIIHISSSWVNAWYSLPPDFPRYVKGEILVKFKSTVNLEKAKMVSAQKGYSVKERSNLTGSYKIRIPDGEDVGEAIGKFKQDESVEYAEPNYYGFAALQPNDPEYLYWYMPDVNQRKVFQKMKFEDAWSINTGSPDIIIAVIDTGVDLSHPDLSSNILRDEQGEVIGKDFVNNPSPPNFPEAQNYGDYLWRDDDPSDDVGHGTWVAGIAAAAGNNYKGVTGSCWDCKIMPVRVMHGVIWWIDKPFRLKMYTAYGTVYDIGDGIRWAADNGANVINLSLAIEEHSLCLWSAINYAYNKGCVIVAAAGNNRENLVYYPAAFDNVIAVSAITLEDKICGFSNYGDEIDVAAPGEDIFSTFPSNWEEIEDPAFQSVTGYGKFSGTSASAPFVSGLAGLILSKNPTLTNDEVKGIIFNSCDDIAYPKGDEWFPGKDIYTGYGRINAHWSLLNVPGVPKITQIKGIVREGYTNIPLPDVTIRIVNLSTNEVKTFTTNERGEYATGEISPGVYNVIAEKGEYIYTIHPEVNVEEETVEIYFLLSKDYLVGDFNNDDKVDENDLKIFQDSFGSMPGKPNWRLLCDLNQDDKIDLDDFGCLVWCFSKIIGKIPPLRSSVTELPQFTPTTSFEVSWTGEAHGDFGIKYYNPNLTVTAENAHQ